MNLLYPILPLFLLFPFAAAIPRSNIHTIQQADHNHHNYDYDPASTRRGDTRRDKNTFTTIGKVLVGGRVVEWLLSTPGVERTRTRRRVEVRHGNGDAMNTSENEGERWYEGDE